MAFSFKEIKLKFVELIPLLLLFFISLNTLYNVTIRTFYKKQRFIKKTAIFDNISQIDDFGIFWRIQKIEIVFVKRIFVNLWNPIYAVISTFFLVCVEKWLFLAVYKRFLSFSEKLMKSHKLTKNEPPFFFNVSF